MGSRLPSPSSLAPRKRVRALVVLTMAAAVLVTSARHAAAGLLDFVTFDGIDYITWIEEPGRALGPGDLGLEFASVECSVGEDARGCPYGTDAGAAFLPAGTRMYAVQGYRTEFRLAAVWTDRVFLYQAWRNPRARVGGDLYDIACKVRAIEIERGEPTPARVSRRLPIRSREDVDRLVALLRESPVHLRDERGHGRHRGAARVPADRRARSRRLTRSRVGIDRATLLACDG